MERSPFDLDALAKIANDLFREPGLDGSVPMSVRAVPGPAVVPSAVQAAVPAVDQGLEASAPHGFGVPAGGATFAPNAPPSRPAFGRSVSADAPIVAYGTGQPQVGATPGPDVGVGPLGFDPQVLPGFAAIPHIQDCFEVPEFGRLGLGSVPSGLPSPAGIPQPSTSEMPSVAQAIPPFAPDLGASPPIGPTAGGAAFSPSAPPTRPSAGRPGPADPTYGLVPSPLFGLDPFAMSGLSAPQGFDVATLGPLASPNILAPTNIPGLAAGPQAQSGPGHLGGLPSGAGTRGIDRPTPTAFQYKDAPHLGEFPEQDHLRSLLTPQHAAPIGLPSAVEQPPAPPANLGGLPSSSTSPSFYFLDDTMAYFADDVPVLPKSAGTLFNAEAIRADFPIFKQRVNGYPLLWLDNGATTQKPQVVIDRVRDFYENENSNIHRAAHELAARATDAYEDARKTVQRFINAPTVDELIFVRGTTEGINLVAASFGGRFIKAGDEIVLTHFEHHANIVPWYLLAKQVGAVLKVAPVDDHGEILLDEYEKLLNDRTKIVAMSHVSNALGTVLPAKIMVEMAHRHGIPVLLDGAQSISHMPIDVQDIDCDFFVFSGHKVFAPTGIGVVYGKKALLDQMPPWQGGGNMIKDVTFEKITFQPAPGRFEAGTGNIADAVGLGAALKYLERLGMTNVSAHEHAVLDYATQGLSRIKGLTIIGQAKEKAGVISFLLEGKAPHEVGKALNQKGIAVRAGHHCALPILRRFGVEATVRPAFALYNSFGDADRLIEAVREIAAD